MSEHKKPGMTADEFRKAAHAVIEQIIEYNENITDYAVLPKIKPGYLAPQLPTSAPEDPEPWPQIQPDIASKIIPGLTHWQSPNFMAYFPAGVTYPGILGEMYSAAFTAPAFNWLCSPACTELETIVLDWMGRALSLPPVFLSDSPTGGGGVIQGSASEAVVTCMVAARERYLHAKCDSEGLPNPSSQRDQRISQLRPRLVALSSDQAHSSTAKGANIAGTLYRSIPTSMSNNLALTGPDLVQALSQVRSEGLEPYYLTLTIGTTSTCAVDDFASLHHVLKSPSTSSSNPNAQIWIHIDAAYAGAALLVRPYSTTLSPASILADSFNTNMHKWLLTPFDASLLWVQSRSHLTRALSISAPYYANSATDSGLVTDYRDWQIPLGRRFRALKIWFVIRSFGLSGLREHVNRTMELGRVFEGLVRSDPNIVRNEDPRGQGLFEVVGEPAFALVCFRVSERCFADEVGGSGRGEKGLVNGTDNANGSGTETNGVEHPTGARTDSAFETVESVEPVEPTKNVEADLRSNNAVDDSAEEEANVATKEVVDAVNADGEIHIIGSVVKGQNIIRVVSANPRAEEKYVRRAFEVIVRVAEEVVVKHGGKILSS